MVYNKTTHTSANSPGVNIRVPGFGNLSAIEYLDEDDLGKSKQVS